MKQSVILWTAAIVITFLAGFAQRIKAPDYPVNGTIDMATGEASFSFDRIYSSKKAYRVWLANNCQNLQGVLHWKNMDDTSWHNILMHADSGIIYAEIPAHPPLSKVIYSVELSDKGETFRVPVKSDVTMQFTGRVPSQISMFYFISLFAGLLLAVRTGFEVFKSNPRLRLYTIFTIISFFSFTFLFSTVKKGCELGIIGGTKIAPIADIFSSGPVILFIWWLLAMILIFNIKKPKIYAGIAAAGTIVIFLAGKF